MNVDLKKAAAVGAFLAAGAVVAVLSPPKAQASAPQPNVVRLVRVSGTHWEGTACWPADGGSSPRCYRTVMDNWEPPNADAAKAP